MNHLQMSATLTEYSLSSSNCDKDIKLYYFVYAADYLISYLLHYCFRLINLSHNTSTAEKSVERVLEITIFTLAFHSPDHVFQGHWYPL